jgi:hypothetical protein
MYGSPVITTADYVRECGLEAEYYGEPDETPEPTIEELRAEWQRLQVASGMTPAAFREAAAALVADDATPAQWVAAAATVAGPAPQADQGCRCGRCGGTGYRSNQSWLRRHPQGMCFRCKGSGKDPRGNR